MAECIPDLHIEGNESFYCNLHHIQNIETGHYSAIVENTFKIRVTHKCKFHKYFKTMAEWCPVFIFLI